MEIIVVDNGSTDGSQSYLQTQKDIKLVTNPKNLGFTGGHIAGYKASTGDFILLLNNDAVMDKEYIERAVSSMSADENIGAIGGRAYIWDENNELYDRTNDFYAFQNINPVTAEGIFTKHDLGIDQSVNVVSGSCVMVRRKITEQIGYLHDPFFAYFEESDLFARMKRAGYKILYSPELAIWHANAKTSNKKAPTFFYYMIMRNRFRFAVRNFDTWSLKRFLKFYVKMGVVSVIKSLLPMEQRSMHQAYAQAFFYNILFGWKAFYERRGLRKSLGVSNYNQLIVREQNGISVVLTCNNSRQLSSYIKLAGEIEPNDELLIVTDDETLQSHHSVKQFNNLRICVNRGYFHAHPDNLGAVCAKNDWLVFSMSNKYEDLKAAFDIFGANLYSIKRSEKKLAFMAERNTKLNSLFDFLHSDISEELMIERSLFKDEGGFDGSLSLVEAKRLIAAYSFIVNSSVAIFKETISNKLKNYTGKTNIDDIRKQLRAKLKQAHNDRREPTFLDKITSRYYRLAQARNLTSWFFYPKIPLKLKLGRTRKVLLAIITFNRLSLATELKHMRNEVMIYKNSLDVVELKENELARLEHLRGNPAETIVFIILRDRYEPLKQLLKWLKTQNLRRIVFIDNDSKLPPLMDYLGKTDYQVLELGRNMTHTAPWSAGIIKLLVPDDYYIVTDPDIIPARNDKDVVPHLYEIHTRHPYHIKVGLGLKIDDLPDHYPLKDEVIKWESQFWEHKVEDNVYEAGVDTTLALYKPHTYRYLLNPSLRTGEPYVARHLPWYSDNKKLSDEEIFYRLRADQNVNSWDKDHLPERYRRELSKKR